MLEEPTDLNATRNQLAAQLAALAPRGTIDRDQLLFEAGRSAALDDARRRRRWLAWSQPAWAALLCGVLLWDGVPAGAERDRPATANGSAVPTAVDPAPELRRGRNRPTDNPFMRQGDNALEGRRLAAGSPALGTNGDNYLRRRNQVVAEIAQGSPQPLHPAPDAVPRDAQKSQPADSQPRGPRQLLKDLDLL